MFEKGFSRNPFCPPFFKGRRTSGRSVVEDSTFSPFGKGGGKGILRSAKKQFVSPLIHLKNNTGAVQGQ
jgi:hypothetical protein